MKRYTVTFERDEEGWWVATARGVKGVHTQGRSIEDARRRVREALGVAIGEAAAAKAELVDDIRLPSAVRTLLIELERARQKEAEAKAEAREVALRATKTLTQRLHLSRRDVAALTGYSFQRIHQLAHEES